MPARHLFLPPSTSASLFLPLQLGRLAELEVSLDVPQFIVRFDGDPTVGELVDELIQHVSADPDQVWASSLAVVRRCLERGFLVPVR